MFFNLTTIFGMHLESVTNRRCSITNIFRLSGIIGERDNLLRKNCYTTFCYRKFVTATFGYSDNLLRDNLLHDILLRV